MRSLIQPAEPVARERIVTPGTIGDTRRSFVCRVRPVRFERYKGRGAFGQPIGKTWPAGSFKCLPNTGHRRAFHSVSKSDSSTAAVQGSSNMVARADNTAEPQESQAPPADCSKGF
jgi:hypothetical protein